MVKSRSKLSKLNAILDHHMKGKLKYFLLFAGIDNLYERALHIRKLLLTLPRSVLIVMRYLFAFLNQ